MRRRDFLWSMLAAAFGLRGLPSPPGRRMAVPSQLRLPIAGQCDASGNLTIPSIQVSPSFYAAFTAILQVSSGSPQWVLTLSQQPIGFAGGQKVVLGSIYTDPTERLTLTVTGAAPNAVVTGGFYGFLAESPELLPQIGFSTGAVGSGGQLPTGQIVVRKTLTNLNDTVAIPTGGSAWVSFSGLTTLPNPSAVVTEGTADDTNWTFIPNLVYNGLSASWGNQSLVGGLGGAEIIVATAGLSQVRLRASVVSGGGFPQNVIVRATPGSAPPMPFGQQLMANSQPVVLASDQGPVRYRQRATFAATATQVASVAAEGMLTLIPVRSGVASAGVTSIPVTAGSVLRITEMVVNYRNNAAAAHFTRFTLRTHVGGAAVVTDPALVVVEVYAQAALALVGQSLAIPFPDGLEFLNSTGDQIGISHLCDAAAVGFSSVTLNGFEYVPT